MNFDMKTILGFVVLMVLVFGVAIAGDLKTVAGLNGGSGFFGTRYALDGNTYGEVVVGPVTTGGSTTTYTVGGLLGFHLMGHHLGAGLSYNSTGTTSYDLVMRHEMPLTHDIDLGFQGGLVHGTSASSNLTWLGSTSIYGVIHM